MTFSPKSLLSNDRRQIAFLFLAVLSLYWYAVSGPVNAIDDPGILKFYGNDRLSLLDVVRPGTGYYYRPLIALSFFLDYHLFAQNPAILHLENVLIHAVNAVLLFLLARRLFPSTPAGLPLAASLLFAVHPVNSEAVNWIAGRTDPLAALFVLLSALSLCRGLGTGRLRWTLLSVLLLLFAVLAKETALLFIPASFLLIQGWLGEHPGAPAESARRQRMALLVCYLAIGLAFVGLIFYRTATSGNSAGKLLAGHQVDPFGSLLFSLRIAGFYLKKMVLPWPLNFAIDSVSGWYAVAGGASLLLLWFLPRKNPYFTTVCAGLLFLVPALGVALFNVAWTQVAERYLYLPSLFLCLGLAGYLDLAARRMGRVRLLAPACLAVLVLFSASTLQRTAVWHSNISLYRDTVAKSPEFAMLHNTLGVVLAEAKQIDEAHQEFNSASALEPSLLLKTLIRRNRMLLAIAGATPAETRLFLNKYGQARDQEDTELLEILRRCDNELMKSTPSGPLRGELIAELIELNTVLYGRTADPLLLYNNGQLHLARGDRRLAADCFGKSYRAAPQDAYYRLAAKKLAEKTGGERL